MHKLIWKKYVLLSLALLIFIHPLATITKAENHDSLQEIELAVTHLKQHASVSSSANVSSSASGYIHRFLGEPLILDGVDRAHDLYYYVPKADLGANNYIALDLSHSELLLPSQSTLTILINDKPLQSLFLTEETSQEKKLEIYLPEEGLVPGYHKLTLFKHSLVSDDLCSDQFNPANWVKIAPTSYLFLDTKSTWTTENLLVDFPHPFIEPGLQEEVFSVILLPDEASPTLISTALHLATQLSATTASKKHLPIYTESEWLKSGALTNAIALGSPHAWTGQIKRIIDEHRIDAEANELSMDFFAIRDIHTDLTKQLLLISGENDQVIQQKIHLLTDAELKKQLTGNQLTIGSTPSISVDTETNENQRSFSSFGYGPLLLDEVKPTSNPLFFRIPAYSPVTDESMLEMIIKISPLLQTELDMSTDSSQVEANGLTIWINDVPKTIPLLDLEPIAEESDTYKLYIPIHEYIQEEHGGLLTLSFTANIGDVGGMCYKQRNSGRWIFIDQDSSLHLANQIVKDASFQYWPAPFVTHHGAEQTALLVPKEINSSILSQLSLLATNLVSDTKNLSYLTVLQDTEESHLIEELKQYNLIIFGEPSNYQALQSVQEKFLLQKENGKLVLANYPLIQETADYLAWIQPSPWNKQHSIAVFQNNRTQEQHLQDIHLHPILLEQLLAETKKSQIIVLSHSDEIVSINLNEKIEKKPDQEVKTLATADQLGTNQFPLWLLALIPTVFIIMMIIFILVWRRKRIDAGNK